jgi:hypothetical protein
MLPLYLRRLPRGHGHQGKKALVRSTYLAVGGLGLLELFSSSVTP